LVASVVLANIGFAISGDRPGHVGALAKGLAILGQFGGWVVTLVVVSRRKGRGSLRRDFGLVVHGRDLWLVVVGVLFPLALGPVLYPILNLVPNQHQGVVNDLESARGLHLAALAVFAGLIAPVCEEVLYRGLLLRALQRRYSPVIAVAISALVFALAHPALDPRWATFAIVPAFFALGAVSGAIAVRRGDLSVSILLHIGFNFPAVLGAVLDAVRHR
jgi:membrane protease YdiL (CAAX protease family)